MSEHGPYSEWYWTWVDHPLVRPLRWLWDAIAHGPQRIIMAWLLLWMVLLLIFEATP